MSQQALRSRLIRVAATLPKGNPTRRAILAAVQRDAGHFHDFVPPPTLDWDGVGRKWDTTLKAAREGLGDFLDVVESIHRGAKQAGPEYAKVADLALRSQGGLRKLILQLDALGDDITLMQGAMPKTSDDF